MRVASDAEEDHASALNALPPRLTSVVARRGYGLDVAFEDGTRGMVDCSGLILGAGAGVFSALRSEAVFATAHLEHGAVTWDCGIDLAPDAMYDAIKRTGTWILA